MLTADAFGVLPPIAKLSPSQAMYHFLSGYTAKVAGTEKGVGTEPQATFSTCFGAPFMPRHPSAYGNMLRELIARHNVDCWLVNTGWTGGKYGVGRRMPIKATRALLDAALSGALKHQPMRTDPLFGFQVPTVAAGRRARHPHPARDLGRQGRLRRPGARAGRHVQQELRQVRDPRRRRRQGRRAGAAAGGGVGSSCPRRVEDAPPARRRAPTIAHRACLDSCVDPRLPCGDHVTPPRGNGRGRRTGGGRCGRRQRTRRGAGRLWPVRSWHRRR